MATAAPPLPPGFVPVPAGPPRVIEGPPREPPPQTAPQRVGDELANELARQRIAQGEREAREAAERATRNRRDVSEARQEIQNVIAAARRAEQASREGWFMTGVGSEWIGGNLPAGRDLRGDLDVIASNTAFDRLQRMRSESPTGGALGSITERELQLLQNTVAALDPGQSDAAFQRNMRTIIARYQGILDRLPSDEAERPEPATPPAQPREPEAGPSAPLEPGPDDPNTLTVNVTGGRMPLSLAEASPEQRAAYGEALSQNPELSFRRFIVSQNPQLRGAGRVDDGEAPTNPAAFNFRPSEIFAFARGGLDTLSLGGPDELAALYNMRYGIPYDTSLGIERGQAEYDEQNHPYARLSGQVAAGFALPIGRVSNVRQLIGAGTGYGIGYGLGSGEGGVGDRLLNAAEGGAVGGAAAGGLGFAGVLANRLRAGGGGSRAAELMEAAQRQGVDMTSPDFNPGQRNLYSFLESIPGAGGRVRGDLQRGADQIEARLADIGGGEAVPRPTAGQMLIDTSRRYIDRSRTVVSRLYDRAATLSSDARITPATALRAIDEHLAELAETPSVNSSKISVLNQLRTDLVDEAGNPRAISIGAFRDLRTAMRDEIGARGLRFTDTERRVMQVIDAAGQDIEAGLSGRALRAYRRADRSHRERAQLVDNVYQRFLGTSRSNPNSPEQAMSALERMAAPRAGDAGSLIEMTGRLAPEERQELASHIASTLGRVGTEGEAAFSPARFFSQIQGYSDEARRAIWGRRGARDLADLAALAEARTGTMARMNNSGSGRVSNWARAVTTLLSGGGAGAATGALTGVGAGAGGAAGAVLAPAALVGAYLKARSLGNPNIVSILAAAARANTAQEQRGVLQSLAQLAAREPALQPDIAPIQQILEGGARSAAAQETEQPR